MSSFYARRKAQRAAQKDGNSSHPYFPQLMETSYLSVTVPIPDSFLAATDGPPVSYTKIDWSKTSLPEYEGSYAAVLDNVLSQAECDELIELAEQSAGSGNVGVENQGWRVALVNGGRNREFLSKEYRNSDRIIWDQKEVVRRIWERCLRAPGLEADLAVVDGNVRVLGRREVEDGMVWRMTRLNERMRFLKYGAGQYFKEHCDGSYQTPDGVERSWYTLHLYLNNSAQELEKENGGMAVDAAEGEDQLLRGGATTFHSFRKAGPMDVDPKAGRVLIFQHKGLLHSGDTVIEGTKYTLRTDLMYTRDPIMEQST